jgi:hypothetical protein
MTPDADKATLLADILPELLAIREDLIACQNRGAEAQERLRHLLHRIKDDDRREMPQPAPATRPARSTSRATEIIV